MEIQHADPRLRRLAVLCLVVFAVVGASALWVFQSWLAGTTRASSPVAQRQLLGAFVAIAGVSCGVLLASSVYTWRLGARIRKVEQFPPPAMRVLRDTPVRRGAAACRQARIIQAIGAAMACCCLALAGATWRLYLALGR